MRSRALRRGQRHTQESLGSWGYTSNKCKWKTLFAKRRKLDYKTENTPYLQWWAEIREDNEDPEAVERHPGDEHDESFVRVFMSPLDESNVNEPQADKIEEFCAGATLEQLYAEDGEGGAKQAPVAWLDERGMKGDILCSRPYRSPLTARDLYHELKKPRYPSGEQGNSGSAEDGQNEASGGSSASPRNEQSGQADIDAERRLIFVTDIDPLVVLALIHTTSYHQVAALRSAIYRHIAFETFIGSEFSTKGLPLFQLAFHLPYYVWRSSPPLRQDPRQDVNGDPLRHSWDVSYLKLNTKRDPGFLYEASISCVVTGSDERQWVAYCFADTYFDQGDEGRESVQSYHNESLLRDGQRMDPLTYANEPADDPIRTPREYFLVVFQNRIEQVKCAWQQVVRKVEQRFRAYEQTNGYSLARLDEHSSLEEAKKHSRTLQKSFDSIVRLHGILTPLTEHLSRTVEACEKFQVQYAPHFHNLSNSAPCIQSLAALQPTLDELDSLHKGLRRLVKRCKDAARRLELYLNFTNVQLASQQRELAQDTNGLSVIMLLIFSPLALSASILSLEKDVIPFIPQRFGSFVVLSLLIAFLGLALNTAPRLKLWGSHIIMAIFARHRADLKPKRLAVNLLSIPTRTKTVRGDEENQGNSAVLTPTAPREGAENTENQKARPLARNDSTCTT